MERNPYLQLVAKLETADGKKTIKGPNGEDSFNLFNIKQFDKKKPGYTALDKAEGSRDAYRVYASHQESEQDMMDLLKRRYPEAHAAMQKPYGPESVLEFATGLKSKGYATDPDYVNKLVRLAGGTTAPRASAAADPVAAPDVLAASAEPAAPAVDASSLVAGLFDEQQAQRQGNTVREDAIAPQRDIEVADELRRAEVGVTDVIGTAFYDPRANALWGAIEHMQKPDADPEFSYYDAPERAEWEKQARSDDELQYLRENATSKDGAYAALSELRARRELDKVYADAGGAANFAGQLAVGIADPVGWALGLGAGKAAQMAIVAGKLSRAGRAGMVVAESVAGNVAWEAVQDGMGEVKDASDYGLAAAFGVGFAVPFIPGAARMTPLEGADAATRQVADEMTLRAAEAKAEARAKGLSPEQAGAAEARVIETELATGSRAEPDDAIVPADVAAAQRLADEAPPAPVPERKTAAKAPKAPEAPTAPAAAENAPQAQPEAVALPRELAGAKPKYRSSAVEFESDLDKALYIVAAPTKRSKADEKYMEWLREQFPGTSDADIRAEGALVRAAVAEADDGSGKISLKAAGEFEAPGKTRTIVVKDTEAEKLSLRTALTGAAKSNAARTNPQVMFINDWLLRTMPASLLDRKFVSLAPNIKARYEAISRTISTPSRGGTPESMDVSGYGNEAGILAHEAVHAATVHVIKAVRDNAPGVTMQQKQAVQRLDELRAELEVELDRRGLPQEEARARYATKNIEEFIAQVFSDVQTRKILAEMPGRGYAGDNALERFYRGMMSLLGFKPREIPVDTALFDAMKMTETLIRTQGDIPNGAGVFFAPTPQQRAITDMAFADRMYDHARDWASRFGVDPKRLEVMAQQLTRKGSSIRDYMVSDGLKMAASKNPIVQMMSGLLVETTTGAAGRRNTAAIHKKMLQQRIVGTAVNDYHTAYADYRKRNSGGHIEDHLTGKVKAAYDKAVYEEIIKRRYALDTPATTDGAVKAGADALEKLYQRSLDVQKEASTLGSGYLPEDSRGYVPQQFNGDALAAAKPADLEELAAHLTDHWIGAYGWSRNFSREFSRLYIQRARQRATGATNGVDFVALESPSSAVRDTLEQMKLESRDLDSRARAELDRVGAMPQNKKRLDVDLLAELPSGKRVIDFYSTDVERLTRSHANTVAGHAALASKGILGRRGVNNLLRAIENAPADELASPDEVAALQRSFSEFLGTPIAGERRSEIASGITSFVRLQRLGGLGFSQLSETVNLVHHIGLGAAMKALGSLPRQVMEIRKLVNKEAVVNPWLASIEQHQGFEFGLEQFRMVTRLDPPDELLREYGKGSSLATRLLQSGNHLQAQVSFFRGLQAAQHRATAEHIMKRAIGYIQDGKLETSLMLQDMGISKQLATAIKADLPQALIRNANGDVIGFDIEKLSTAKAREELIQSVHRGTAQIIQDTFIGERAAWAHDDWAKLLLQLRTFGLTAMEKQWGRTRVVNSNGPMNGYGYAAGVLVGQMAFASMIYAARAQVYAAGREDREDFLEKAYAPASMLQASLNYSSMSGLSGDATDILASIAGGWDSDVKEALGTRSFATGIGGLIPAAGSFDAGMRVVQGKSDLHGALKQLPGSNLPWIAPILNLVKED